MTEQTLDMQEIANAANNVYGWDYSIRQFSVGRNNLGKLTDHRGREFVFVGSTYVGMLDRSRGTLLLDRRGFNETRTVAMG